MSLIGKLLAKWEGPSVFSAWAFAFIVLFDQGHYKSFLRPEFGLLLVLGLALLLAILLAYAQGGWQAHEDSVETAKRLSRMLLLLLPLAFLINASGGILDAGAYKMRSTGTAGGSFNAGGSGVQAPPVLVPPSTEMEAASQDAPVLVPASTETGKAATTPIPQSGPLDPGFVELATNPRAYAGKQVMAIGMLYRDDEVKKRFGERAFLLFRFAIVCCAADARPLALIMRPRSPCKFKENQWLEVKGKLRAVEEGPNIISVLENPELKAVKAPGNPYVYP